jgi:hypothetical protein
MDNCAYLRFVNGCNISTRPLFLRAARCCMIFLWSVFEQQAWKGLKEIQLGLDVVCDMAVNYCKMSNQSGFRCSPVFLLLLLVPAFVFLGYRGTSTSSVPSSLRVSMTSPGTTNPAILQRLSKSSPAKCIDGSSPSYYIRHGTGSGKQKWVIFFEGGGWCYNLEQCYFRSKTRLGSSRGYAQVLSEEHMGYYVSADEQINPQMHNWNTVYVNYCDGSSFAGDTAVPYKVRLS